MRVEGPPDGAWGDSNGGLNGFITSLRVVVLLRVLEGSGKRGEGSLVCPVVGIIKEGRYRWEEEINVKIWIEEERVTVQLRDGCKDGKGERNGVLGM